MKKASMQSWVIIFALIWIIGFIIISSGCSQQTERCTNTDKCFINDREYNCSYFQNRFPHSWSECEQDIQLDMNWNDVDEAGWIK